MEVYCEFFEPDEHGNICHASENDECPNYSECTAMYDVHGNQKRVDATTRTIYRTNKGE